MQSQGLPQPKERWLSCQGQTPLSHCTGAAPLHCPSISRKANNPVLAPAQWQEPSPPHPLFTTWKTNCKLKSLCPDSVWELPQLRLDEIRQKAHWSKYPENNCCKVHCGISITVIFYEVKKKNYSVLQLKARNHLRDLISFLHSALNITATIYNFK